MTKKIIGIDPGTKAFGWGVISIENNRYQFVDAAVIEPSDGLKLEEKYLFLFEELTKVIDMHQPSILSVETQFVDKNVQSAIKLGMARGVAFVVAAKKKIEVMEFAPTKAKLAVTGKGNSSKDAVHKMCKTLLNIKEKDLKLDATDALSLAITAFHFMNSKPMLSNSKKRGKRELSQNLKIVTRNTKNEALCTKP
jgi:crossover junction endodeoxyribonuclease RuvC